MLKKILTVFILAMGLSASACWFTAVNYDKCYIARINTLNTYMTGETFQVYRVSGAGATDANGYCASITITNNAPTGGINSVSVNYGGIG